MQTPSYRPIYWILLSQLVICLILPVVHMLPLPVYIQAFPVAFWTVVIGETCAIVAALAILWD